MSYRLLLLVSMGNMCVLCVIRGFAGCWLLVLLDSREGQRHRNHFVLSASFVGRRLHGGC